LGIIELYSSESPVSSRPLKVVNSFGQFLSESLQSKSCASQTKSLTS
jgi:hypothetical protein